METRSIFARVGIVALNLLQPGLGLLRVGRLGPALLLLGAPILLLSLVLLSYGALPEPGPMQWMIAVAVLVLAMGAVCVAAMVLSWRWSKTRAPVRRSSRWYAILAVYLVSVVVANVEVEAAHRFYKTFYIRSEAMLPTVAKGDRLLASMGLPAPIRRGDLLLVKAPGNAAYLKRVAALPGDRIAMTGGIVSLDGRPVAQRLVGTDPYAASSIARTARRLQERFPGERSPHEIYDLGAFPDMDDLPETTVAPGHLFLLGDNRDESADSRIPREESGLAQVPMMDVVGRPLFVYWSLDRSRIGTRLRN